METSRADDVELIPGTEIMLLDGMKKDLILVPHPSSDPHDPLNWSTKWKWTVIINQSIFVWISVLTPLAIAPLTGIFIQEFQRTLPEVNMLFGAAAITLGYSNLLIVPLANVFGRRPVLLLCALICIGANIWQADVKSFDSFIGARVLSGIGAGAGESIMVMVIDDMIFLHNRGLYLGLYFWAYFMGTFLGPIIAGTIAGEASWRWFFWTCTTLQGVNFLMLIVTFPETRYRREDSAGSLGAPFALRSGSEKSARKPAVSLAANELKDEPALDIESGDSGAFPDRRPALAVTPTGTGKPSRAQWSLIPRPQYEGRDMIIWDIIAPFQIFSVPIVLWASFGMGFAANCLLGLNLTQAQVFQAPPYLFSARETGFVNFAFVAGGAIGLLTAGPISDAVSMWQTKRNGGVREPEMRLVALFPYIGMTVVGMTVASVGYQHVWAWPKIVVVGYGLVGVEVVSIPAIVIAYAIDSYNKIPGQIMLSATIIKNTFGFGMIFFFNDWTISAGYVPPFMMLMALAVGINLIGAIVFIRWGKTFRRWTRNSKLHSL